jgi:hypothetical protein
MLAVGDIAACDSDGDEATAVLVDSVLRADSAAKVNDVVVTMGDNAYPDGSASNFLICWVESWGDSTKMIMDKIRPSVGNHEHRSLRAAPYYQYFGDKAGDPTKGYYSYDHGEWRVFALNSEIIVNPVFSSAEREAQEAWLRAELAASQKPCMIAYFHHPLFSSGHHGNDNRIRPIWEILQAAKVTLVLVGHDHHYERFHPSARQMYLRAKEKFARLGVRVFMSLDLEEYQSQLDAALSWLLIAADPRQIAMPEITPPKIRLLERVDQFD